MSSQGEKSDSSAGESATVLRGLLTSPAGGGLGRTAILRKYYGDLLEAERKDAKVNEMLLWLGTQFLYFRPCWVGCVLLNLAA